MKRFLAPIVLLTLLFPSLAFGETMDDLIFRSSNGLHYKKYTEVPFTGKVTGKTQGSFRNGMRVGLWVHYHRDGWLESKGTFKDGKKDGPWVHYYDDGQLLSEGTYKNGKNHGPYVFYTPDGTVFEPFTGTFKDGVKVKQ